MSYTLTEAAEATGKVRSMGPGQSVFTSADGRRVFLARTDTKVIELSGRGSGAKRELTLPRGGWRRPTVAPRSFSRRWCPGTSVACVR